ncbi:MAG: cell division topological specificity factor MinE [Clostridia bacterium]|jgi:cell division topological specificity factor|nr:cell division topological specificity factor MinE [Clostridia bacterium]
MFGLFSKLKGKEGMPSKNLAKERLRLVLVHDRSDVSPQLLQSLKDDMLKVISGYMDIDQGGTEVKLYSDEKSVSLTATIPVLKIKRLSL